MNYKFNYFIKRLLTGQLGEDPFFLGFVKKYPKWAEENPDYLSAVGVNKYQDDLDLYAMMFDNKDRKWVSWKKFQAEFNKTARVRYMMFVE